jgi:hypothetical protein
MHYLYPSVQHQLCFFRNYTTTSIVEEVYMVILTIICHINKIHNNNATDVPQTQLAGNLHP